MAKINEGEIDILVRENAVLSSKIPIRPFTSKDKALEVLKRFFKGKQENAMAEERALKLQKI